MNERTRTSAIKALDRMHELVRRERIVAGDYAEQVPANRYDPKALCKGSRFCAVGSLYVGYGIVPEIAERDVDAIWLELPGIENVSRDRFMARRPGLRAAYDALNDEAMSLVARRDDLVMSPLFVAPIEKLFEGNWEQASGASTHALTRGDLMRLIRRAQRRVEAAG